MRTAKGHWIAFAVCVVLALFGAFLTLGGIVAASDDLTAGERHDDAIAAGVVGAITVALIVAAIHFEHRARRPRAAGPSAGYGSGLAAQAVQQFEYASDAKAARADSPPRPRRRTTRRKEVKNSPAGLVVTIVLMTTLTGLFAWGSVHVYHDNQRFLRTKADGIPATATITDNVLHTYHGRGGTTYTTEIHLSLDDPVDGVSAERINISGQHTTGYYASGSSVDVLVDPDDPRYAIFTNQTTSDGATWIALLCFAVVTGAVDVLAVVGLVKLKQRLAAAKRDPGFIAPPAQ